MTQHPRAGRTVYGIRGHLPMTPEQDALARRMAESQPITVPAELLQECRVTTTDQPATPEQLAPTEPETAVHTDDLAAVAKVARDLLADLPGKGTVQPNHLADAYAERTGTTRVAARTLVSAAVTYGYLTADTYLGTEYVKPVDRQAADLYDLRCANGPQESARPALPLVEDDDGAPYPGNVQDAVTAVVDATLTALHGDRWAEQARHQDTAEHLQNALAPTLLRVIADAETETIAETTAGPEPTTTYALALMRSTLLTDAHATHAQADDVCAALAPQVRRMLADADARVDRARATGRAEAEAAVAAADDAALAERKTLAAGSPGWESSGQRRDGIVRALQAIRADQGSALAAALDQAHAVCFAGAADDPGDPLATPTPEQWLRRLFDLPVGRRLDVARATIALAGQAQSCFVGNHRGRIADLERQVADHAAEVRDARRTAAERSWDAAADSLLAEDATIAAMLRAANPNRNLAPEPEGTDPQ